MGSIDEAPLIVICAPEAASARRDALERAGAEVIVATGRNDQARLGAALDELGRREIQDLLVEGGPTFAGALFDAGEIDEVRLFIAPVFSAPPRPAPCSRATAPGGSPTGCGPWRPASSRSARTCWSGRGCGSGEALMFTGIISELGSVEAVEATDEGARLRIRADLASELEPGDSVAVNGACLTATSVGGGEFEADVMHQTLSLTTLGELEPASRVNLELPLRPTDRLGGHVVQGHVDGTAAVADLSADGFAKRLRVELPDELLPYVVERGLDRDRGRQPDDRGPRRRVARGLADSRDARAHDPGSARARRPGQRRVRHAGPLRAAPAAHRSRHVTLIKRGCSAGGAEEQPI